jgi:hypothetical protein
MNSIIKLTIRTINSPLLTYEIKPKLSRNDYLLRNSVRIRAYFGEAANYVARH